MVYLIVFVFKRNFPIFLTHFLFPIPRSEWGRAAPPRPSFSGASADDPRPPISSSFKWNEWGRPIPSTSFIFPFLLFLSPNDDVYVWADALEDTPEEGPTCGAQGTTLPYFEELFRACSASRSFLFWKRVEPTHVDETLVWRLIPITFTPPKPRVVSVEIVNIRIRSDASTRSR